MSLVSSAVVATALSTATPAPSQLWLPPSVPYTLAADTSDGRQTSELADLERKMNIAHGFYSVGTMGMLGGGVTTAAGAGLTLIGVIAAFGGDDTLLKTGLVTMAVGAGVVVISVPVFMSSSWVGAAVLRHHGIHVSRIPGWVMLGGAATLLVGLRVDQSAMVGAGAAGGIGAGLVQVIATRRAFNAYESEVGASKTQAMLVPQWSPDGGAGLSLVVQF